MHHNMLKQTFLIFSIFILLLLKSEAGEVTQLLNDHEIEIDLQNLSIGDVLLISSDSDENIVGYAKIVKVEMQKNSVGEVIYHPKNKLIRVGNKVRKLDLLNEKEFVPGRFDLISKSNRHISVKYRPIVYTGLFTEQTGHTLAQGEVLAGPTFLGYGITDNVQIHTKPVNHVLRVHNLGIKHNFFSSDEFILSAGSEVNYYSEQSKAQYVFNGYFSIPSNGRFESQARLKMFTKKPKDRFVQNKDSYEKDFNAELLLASMIITPNWNRVMIGPQIDFEKNRIGGVVGYCYLKGISSILFTVQSKDFTEGQYTTGLDFWWRF